MKALILNSGTGSRMGELTKARPKCMVEIDGKQTILSRQLTLLEAAGIHDIVITTGPFADTLEQYVCSLKLDLNVKFVNNSLYASTNYIYSMYLAKASLQDDILLFHGDLVFEPAILNELIQSPQSAMVIDSGLPLPDKDFKARLINGKIAAVGVDIFGRDCVACQPAYKLAARDFQTWMAEISAFCNRHERGVYAENALNNVSCNMNIQPLEAQGRLCREVDNEQDLAGIVRELRG